jgi:hypothetical protein
MTARKLAGALLFAAATEYRVAAIASVVESTNKQSAMVSTVDAEPHALNSITKLDEALVGVIAKVINSSPSVFWGIVSSLGMTAVVVAGVLDVATTT